MNGTHTVYLKLLVTMALWGFAWPVGRLLAAGLPALSIATIRYAIVVPIFFRILQFKEHSVGVPKVWLKTFLVLGILNTTLYQAFFLFGVKYAAASDDSLVIGIGPILIAAMAAVLVKEPLGRTKVLGLSIGLLGVATISFLSPNIEVLNRPLGMSLVFGGALVYAAYTVLLRRFISNSSNQPESRKPTSLAIISWVSLLGWLFLIPLSLLESPWNYAWDADSWLGILYLALFSTVVGYLFFVDGVSQIGASRAAIFSNLVPVFGVLSSFLLLRESLSVWHGASFLLILLGVVLVNKKPLKTKSRLAVAVPNLGTSTSANRSSVG